MSEAAKAVLRAAAPGQFDAVAENLQKVGQASSLSADWLTELQADAKEFRCEGIHASDIDHPIAKPLHEKIENYQTKNFLSKPGVTARVALTHGDEHNQLRVHTYAQKIDAPNQYAASWKATWSIRATELGVAEISGKVALHSYAHEGGNVQLQIQKEFPPTRVGRASAEDGAEATLVDGIVEQIRTWETILLGILETMNDSVSSDHLKAIRRVLPFTKTKMNWDVIAHRSVQTLKKTAPETRSKVKYNN